MATLGSLNLGDYVYDPMTYNTITAGGSNGMKSPVNCLSWMVIGKNHDGNNTVTLMLREGTIFPPNCPFDEKEPTNPNSDRQTNGNSRYKFSNILQCLNSDADKNWYTSKHQYDAVGSSNNYPAFLYSFSSQLKNALQTVSKKVYVPYVDAGNNTTSENVSAKVHLLSVKEIFGDTINNVLDEGTQYEYFQDESTLYTSRPLRSAKYDGTTIDGSYVETNIINYGSKSRTPYKALQTGSCSPIITLPASTKVSSNKYWRNGTYGSDSNAHYAMLNMPLVLQVKGLSTFTRNISTYPNKPITYTIYDEDYAITSFKIARDTVDNVIYSTTTITKGQENTYNLDVSGYALNESHTFYFIVEDANGNKVTESGTITRTNAVPTIFVYNPDSEEWVERYALYGNITKPPTVRLKINDLDNNGENIYVALCEYGDSTIVYDNIGTYTQGQEITYTIPDNIWKSLNDGNVFYWIVASNLTFPTNSGSYCAYMIYSKITPAPYVTVDSTDIGQKNKAFEVTYTPDTDTIQALTNVSTYLDSGDNLIQSINNPTAGSQLSIAITKAMLASLSLGSHKLIFTVTDDLSQTGTTEVTFTKYNDAPNVIMESTLGNKNLGFDVSFSIQDEEEDIASVSMYIDSTTGTPIKVWSNVQTGSNLTQTISKETLYGLSLGNHNIYVIAEDEYGSTTATASFTRYNDAPVVTASQDTTIHYDDFDVTYQVTDTENDDVNLVFKVDNTTIATVTNVNKGELLTQVIDISDWEYGQKTLNIIATDNQGQTSTTSLDFTISTVPVITADDIGNKAEPFSTTIKVDDEDGDALHVIAMLNDVELLNQENAPHNTPIQITIDNVLFNHIQYGIHTINISLSDVNGSTVTKDITFNKCSVPTLTVNTPIPQEIENELNIEVEYSNADGSEVSVKAYIDGREIPQ